MSREPYTTDPTLLYYPARRGEIEIFGPHLCPYHPYHSPYSYILH